MTNKNWKWNALAIVATVAAAAAPAFAEDLTMRATIPFAFSISKDAANLAPGKYVVTHAGEVWRLRSEDSRKTVLISNFSGHQGKSAEEPSLSFDCLGTHCQLRAINMGYGAVGAEVPAPQLGNDRAELGLVSVALKPVK